MNRQNETQKDLDDWVDSIIGCLQKFQKRIEYLEKKDTKQGE
jgi:hypothetical protein